jgi:hypothetical protein
MVAMVRRGAAGSWPMLTANHELSARKAMPARRPEKAPQPSQLEVVPGRSVAETGRRPLSAEPVDGGLAVGVPPS